MITVAAAVAQIVKGSPVLEEGLASGILNLSAVARALHPQVEALARKPVGEGAIVVALSRLAPRLTRRTAEARRLARQIRDLTVRSNITEYTFPNSPTSLKRVSALLKEVQKGGGAPFATFTQGAHELTVLVTPDLEPAVEKAFAGERRIARLPNLAAIGIHHTPKVVEMPGVYYAILKQLMWGHINAVELVSTYTELVIILDKRDVDRAFATLKCFFWP
jgi:hypothetical protein